VFKRIFLTMLSTVLLASTLGLQSVWAQTTDAEVAARARAKVASLGVGRNARVEVKLRDKTTLKGYISATEQDSFTVADSKTGSSSNVRYAEVSEVKKPGGGLSTKSWIIIGAAAVGTAAAWFIVKPAFCDGGAQTRFPC
jgi:hypothetical protein